MNKNIKYKGLTNKKIGIDSIKAFGAVLYQLTKI
jgi:hypothetical protein